MMLLLNFINQKFVAKYKIEIQIKKKQKNKKEISYDLTQFFNA